MSILALQTLKTGTITLNLKPADGTPPVKAGCRMMSQVPVLTQATLLGLWVMNRSRMES